MFRLVWSCCPSRFGDPKGITLRIPPAKGFNPAVGDEVRRSRSTPISGVPRGQDSWVWIGDFVTETFGDGADVSPRNTFTRLLNCCFGVSMPGTLKGRSPASQPMANALICQEVSGRSRRCQSRRAPSPTGRKNTPALCRRGRPRPYSPTLRSCASQPEHRSSEPKLELRHGRRPWRIGCESFSVRFLATPVGSGEEPAQRS